MRLFRKRRKCINLTKCAALLDGHVVKVYATGKTFRGRMLFLERQERDNLGDEILLGCSLYSHLNDEL